MSKFTEGEWSILDDSRSKDGSGYIRIGTKKKSWIAEAKGNHVGPKSKKECMANAKLIAAAPELLEACRSALLLFEFENTHGVARLALIAAIKKATK